MKSVITLLILYLTYCYCERLLGGWSTSDNENLKRDCLNRALVHINGASITDDTKSEASDLICKTQIVNGLNIKCYFSLRGQKWECSYYKSFIQTLETQLEQCKQVENEPAPAVAAPQQQQNIEQDDDDDELGTEDGGQRQQQQQQQVLTSNNGQKEERPLAGEDDEDQEDKQETPANEDQEDKQSETAVNEEEKEKQVAGESLMANDNNQEEDDDEAKIDALRNNMPAENGNNEVEQQPQK